MKRILIIPLVILLCTSFSGCVKDKNTSTSSNSNIASSISIEDKNSNTTVATDKSKANSSVIASKSDDDKLMSQLSDLEDALSSLDQITEDDLVIPQPNP